MIGPGTGIAPFRGFIQERSFLKDDGKPVGESILYFGCRKKAEDFIYEEELEEYIKKDVIKVIKRCNFLICLLLCALDVTFKPHN
jgi:NADPH-ferrihemoprotein reductase